MVMPREAPSCRVGSRAMGNAGPALLDGCTGAADPSLMRHQELYSWLYGFILVE